MPKFNVKNVEKAPDKIKAGAEEMIKAPMWLIEQILLKHENAVLEVIKELHDENAALKEKIGFAVHLLRDIAAEPCNYDMEKQPAIYCANKFLAALDGREWPQVVSPNAGVERHAPQTDCGSDEARNRVSARTTC